MPFLRGKYKKGDDRIKNKKTTKEWLPFDEILENGVIIKNKTYIKLIKVLPINYDLKSNLEKEAILNSYKLFLKTCDFNIQILIQSKKEDLSNYFNILKEMSQKENNEKILEITNDYINFIKSKSEENRSSTKVFYLIVSYTINSEVKDKEQNIDRKNFANNILNEFYFKIKETLSRCGNIIYDVNSKEEVEKILLEFFVNNEKIKKDWK